MPWKEKLVVDQRTEFVLRALHEQATFAELCEEYGISRKTGYKWKERFLQGGLPALQDDSRRPDRSPDALPEQVVCEVVRLKEAHRTWGARKLAALYQRLHGQEQTPSESSFKRVLDRCGLVEHRQPRRKSEQAGRLQCGMVAQKPNELWTVDFKGWWRSSDQQRCEPLTVRDAYSRYLLCVRPLADACSETVRRQFVLLFERHGLPEAIRSDNGVPFACCNAPLGLSRLSAWWVALGINLDRTDPGHPEQNGSHERMHRDLAAEVQYAKSGSLSELIEALELWRQSYNQERPHEALGMKRPSELYAPSPSRYDGDPEQLEYPLGYQVRRVQRRGTIGIEGQRILISTALSGWEVGLKPEAQDRYSVYFGRLCLGVVDLATLSFQCLPEQPAPAAGAPEEVKAA
jgi:transposase InsO family protein